MRRRLCTGRHCRLVVSNSAAKMNLHSMSALRRPQGRLIFRLDVTNPKGKSVCIIAEVADLENSKDLTRSVLSKLENLRRNFNAESARYARPTAYR